MSNILPASYLSSGSISEDNINFSYLVGIDTVNLAQSVSGSVVNFSVSSLYTEFWNASSDNLIFLNTVVAENSANWDSTYNTVSESSASWTGGGGLTISARTITSTTTLQFDASMVDQYIISVSGSNVSAIFAYPTNGTNKQLLVWDVRFLSNNTYVELSSNFRLPTTTLNWSNSANKLDMIASKFNTQDNKWDVVSFLPGFSI